MMAKQIRPPESEMSPTEMKFAVHPMPLAVARELAESCARVCGQFCSRVEIAGSIRRGRPMCGDVDLAVMPKSDQAWLELIERVKVKLEIQTCGDDNIIAVHREGKWQLDIFRAREGESNLFGEREPGTFGVIWLIRTGSKYHNIYLCNEAARLGLHLHPQRGLLKQGRVIASETEEEIFKALNMEFIEPERRER